MKKALSLILAVVIMAALSISVLATDSPSAGRSITIVKTEILGSDGNVVTGTVTGTVSAVTKTETIDFSKVAVAQNKEYTVTEMFNLAIAGTLENGQTVRFTVDLSNEIGTKSFVLLQKDGAAWKVVEGVKLDSDGNLIFTADSNAVFAIALETGTKKVDTDDTEEKSKVGLVLLFIGLGFACIGVGLYFFMMAHKDKVDENSQLEAEESQPEAEEAQPEAEEAQPKAEGNNNSDGE